MQAVIGVNAFEHCPDDIVIKRRGKVQYSLDDDISFADPIVRDVCIKTWGQNGHFTFADAAKVTSMGEHRHEEMKYDDTSFVFDEIEAADRPHCESFNELRYFVNLINIDSYSFTQCEDLKEITLPDSVENIGDMAFVFCTSLKHIYIPDNVKHIARWAFRGCTSLEEISLPKNVQLGKGVFDDCSPMLKIIYRS